LTITALVIGYGSIGKRHLGILKNNSKINKLAVLSNQKNLPYKTLSSLEEAINLNPHYVVIASNTSLHFKHLTFFEENMKNIKILVEKPLFDSYQNLIISNNKVFVGYNLRFHPLIQLLKKKILGKKIWNIQVFCGSYLPDWRKDIDYRLSCSAKKTLGGGVLLDLSHELDYISWLFGSMNLKYVYNRKVSNLDIDTDDLLIISSKTKENAHINISLNYFTKKPIRQILIDGENISIQADLITSSVTVYENNKFSEYKWPDINKNSTYMSEHEAILSGNFSNVCSFEEGIKTIKLIDKIKTFQQ